MVAYLAWLLAQEVVSLLEQDGEGGGGMVVLHGGHIIVADLGGRGCTENFREEARHALRVKAAAAWWFSMGDMLS